jgi:hypothetical protein
MAEHDDEAPKATDLLATLPAARRRGRSNWYVVAAAAVVVVAVVVVAVVAGVWAARGPSHNAPATKSIPVRAMSCPSVYAGRAPWVPAKPTGVDTHARLVPPQPPATALICAYDGVNGSSRQRNWALTGQRQLAGELGRISAELSWLPRNAPDAKYACGAVAGRQVNYLIGLAYQGGGTIWVSATDEPNFCVRGSNGAFTTDPGAAGRDVTKALTTGTWPARTPTSCRLPGTGRLGQDATMVPAGATSLTICTNSGHVIRSGYQPLISALNTLRTHAASAMCTEHGHGVRYQLLFSYPAGPPAVVNVDSACSPPIQNRSREAGKTGTVLPIIQQLLKKH